MKAWSDRVREHIQFWSGALPGRDWWPRYVYHFTDLHNAVSILGSAKLYSRSEVNRLRLLHTDAASAAVIAQTSPAHLQYVRLYFRPRTPTQFRNEGIRPRSNRWENAHCPVPVFLCFDAHEVLTRGDTELSNGNMGSSHVEHAAAREIFEKIPFHHVFHDGRWAPHEGEAIKFHRHAEVLVPDALPLKPSLKMIVCRSAAERMTLLHLLPEPARLTWERLVRLGYDGLFERKWTFVESVTTVGTSIEFQFNPNTQTPGAFEVEFVYREEDGRSWTWTGQKDALTTPHRFTVEGATRGIATLKLDGCIAFAGQVTFEDTPF